MKRLEQLKAKLKLKQAESVIRIRNYGTASRNLAKNIEEIRILKERITHETTKLAGTK